MHLVSAWIYTRDAKSNVSLFVDARGTELDYPAGSIGWSLHVLLFKAPANGTIKVGFSAFGTAGSVCSIAKPLVSVLGVPISSYFGGDPTQTLVHYRSSAAPAAGTWAVGDVVWNSAPAEGGSMGWVCTAGGTSPTWKTFGAISA